MHQLFSQVLGRRDLSRAGDLFSLEDAEIEECLSQALDQIKVISCSPVSRDHHSECIYLKTWRGQCHSLSLSIAFHP